jgi:predicted ATPase
VKTRLSLQVAADVGDHYADGVWWVDLSRLSDPAFLANAVAVPLAIKEVPGQPLVDTLKYHLRDQRALLVLDNCEHVVDACAQLVHELLQGCPSLSILTTSREPIGVEGETSWRVPSLRCSILWRLLPLRIFHRPGVTPDPPPTGPDLERRRRFH